MSLIYFNVKYFSKKTKHSTTTQLGIYTIDGEAKIAKLSLSTAFVDMH